MTRFAKAAALPLLAAGLLLAAPALARAAEAWRPITYNDDGVGLVDLASLETTGGVTRARIAIVLSKPQGDFQILELVEELRCGDLTARPVLFRGYDADGAQMGPERKLEEAYAPIAKGSNLENLAAVVCAPLKAGETSYASLKVARTAVLAELRAN